MLNYIRQNWQEITVWLILGLVILALLYYIGRRLKLLKNVAQKNSGSCSSCQGCSQALENCAKAESQRELED